MQSLMFPFVRQGPLREVMVRALRCVRANQDLFNAALGIFIRETTKDWEMLARKQAALQRLSTASTTKDFPVKKVEMVKKKIAGSHPALAALDELEMAMDVNKNKVAVRQTYLKLPYITSFFANILGLLGLHQECFTWRPG